MYESIGIIALFVVVYSTIAGRIESSLISGPIVYVGFGLLAGPVGLGWLDIDLSSNELRVAADLSLALILFLDASNADLGVLRRFLGIPQRMLLIGLPLTIGLGYLAGGFCFDTLGTFQLAILATMLAATDAALGKPVIVNPRVPQRLREGLNLESGLNDGICVPVLLLFIALALGQQGDQSVADLTVELLVREIGIGLAVGLAISCAGTYLISMGSARGWLTDIWRQVTVVGMAIAAFCLAQTLHGSGYIAAFSGGLLFNFLAKKHKHELVHSAEGIAETLALATWVLFGAGVVGQVFEHFTAGVFLFAFLSLTIVRMLPMLIALTGTGLSLHEKLFLGWFGPRGLASIVFSVIVLGYDVPGGEILSLIVVCTVLLSVIAHGMTANPLAKRFDTAEPDDAGSPEG